MLTACRLRQLGLAVACLAILGLSGAFPDRVAQAARVGLLVSGNIRPYVEAAEGVRETLAANPDIRCDTFTLEKYSEAQLADFSREIGEQDLDLAIAIGPDAARFAWSSFASRKVPLLYAMVLNPDNVIGAGGGACGVSLNIPIEDQLIAIRRGQPAARRLGLLFDPLNNRQFFEEAQQAAAAYGLSILALEVSSKRDIPIILQKNWIRVDALWFVPDRTVISESIVQYVIQEAIYKKVPVIGYNRFFYESGASLAFVIDYREVGAQCAREAVRVLAGAPCRRVPPVFHFWVNTRVMGKLGVQGPENFTPPLQEGP